MKNIKQKEYRTFLSLGAIGSALERYADTDPRFKNRSSAARHLLTLGMQADKENREKALNEISKAKMAQ